MPKDENKASEKGMAKESGHPSTVHHMEYAGSPGHKHSGGTKFKMPSDAQCSDHSKVHAPK